MYDCQGTLPFKYKQNNAENKEKKNNRYMSKRVIVV